MVIVSGLLNSTRSSTADPEHDFRSVIKPSCLTRGNEATPFRRTAITQLHYLQAPGTPSPAPGVNTDSDRKVYCSDWS